MSFIQVDRGLFDIYDHYKKRQKKKGRLVKDLPKRWEYKKVIQMLNHKLVREVLTEEGRSFKMPYRLGELYAVKRGLPNPIDKDGKLDKSKLEIDWGKTRALWVEEYGKLSNKEYKQIKDKPMVYLSIDHRVGFRWEKANAQHKNARYYTMRMMQHHNRYLGKYSSKDNNHRIYRRLPNKKSL